MNVELARDVGAQPEFLQELKEQRPYAGVSNQSI